jgi:hypothetical protein
VVAGVRPDFAFAPDGRLLHALAFQEPRNNHTRNPEDAVPPLAASGFASPKVYNAGFVREQAAHCVLAYSQHFRHFRYCPELFVHVAILPVPAVLAD